MKEKKIRVSRSWECPNKPPYCCYLPLFNVFDMSELISAAALHPASCRRPLDLPRVFSCNVAQQQKPKVLGLTGMRDPRFVIPGLLCCKHCKKQGEICSHGSYLHKS